MKAREEDKVYNVVSREKVQIGRFTIVKDIISIDGEEYPYSFEKVDDAVCILPIINGCVILIRQYRHSISKWIWELPAGGLSGDEPLIAAKRELCEETGYTASIWKELGCFYVSPGTSSDRTFFYAAICDENIGQQCESTEFIEVHKVSFQDFEDMINEQKISFSGTVLAWELYKKKYGGFANVKD